MYVATTVRQCSCLLIPDIRSGDECKVKGSPPERPSAPPSTKRRHIDLDLPFYDSIWSDTPFRAHPFTDLSFRGLPRPYLEGFDEDRARERLARLLPDGALSDNERSDLERSDNDQSDNDSSEESDGSSQSPDAAQPGSVQREGSKGISKRIGLRGPISAVNGVDNSGPSTKLHPAVKNTDERIASTQRTEFLAPKTGRHTTKHSEFAVPFSNLYPSSKHSPSTKRSDSSASDCDRFWTNGRGLRRNLAATRANAIASTSSVEDAVDTAGPKPNVGSKHFTGWLEDADDTAGRKHKRGSKVSNGGE
jgi:hypothetical protein